MNAYEMFQEIRDNVGEATAAHWSDLAILRKINAAQRKAYTLISQTPGDWLVKKETLTPVASVVTLPADCAKPVVLRKNSNGVEIPLNTSIRERDVTRLSVTGFDIIDRDAYLLEGTIEINEAGFTDQVDLWYERRVPKLHFGTASAGGATSLTLEASKQQSLQDDYYNSMTIEVVGGTGAGTRTTVSDYDGGTRVITTAAGTFSTDSVYGLVSVLPEESSDYIILDATVGLLARPGSALDPKYFEYFQSQMTKAKNDFEEFCSMRLKNSLRTRITDYHEV
ncbi:MAG: phage adaptor protein [Candidatus Thorarchaeota archaeon]|jgi:hypothetical protein